MGVNGFYQTLFDALCKQDMNELARAAHEILDMPVVVADAAFIVRAKYPDAPVDDEQWDANTMNRQIEPRFVKTFADDDHFAHHVEAGKAILTDWGHYEEAPRLTSIIRTNGTALGYFAALATGVDVQPWHFEAADTIGRAFAVLMDTGATARLARSGLTSPALYALLDGPMRSTVNLQLLPSEFFEQNRPPYMLFCARTRNPHNALLEMYLGNELAQYFEQATQTVYKGALYILASGVTGDARGSVRSNLLVEELKRQKLHCGSSRPFADLAEIRLHAWEASSALATGARLGLEGPLFHYDNLMVDIACSILDDNMPGSALETPSINALKRRDQTSGTSYLETLKVYYATRFDKKRTCEELHIHRNTLQYRLDRIAEMVKEDIDSPLCAFYFALQEYRERVARAETASPGASASAGKGGRR